MAMKLLIEVQSNKPLSSYGDNHIIAYDSNNKNYYVTTAESFFASQNNKIKAMIDEVNTMNTNINQFKQDIDKFEAGLLNRVNSFQQDTNRKFEEFIHQYQETNARLIAMVRELVEAKNEEE